MSRIGKKPIPIPPGVTATLENGTLQVRGPKGELERRLHPDMEVRLAKGLISIVPRRESKQSSALWGLTRSLIANMVAGVASGFQKRLEFEGVGFRASVEGNGLKFQLGFSHPVFFPAPAGIVFTVEKNMITVAGTDKELVGQTAARIRALKPPEPYKGKGIRYQGEVIRRKAGKKAVTSA